MRRSRSAWARAAACAALLCAAGTVAQAAATRAERLPLETRVKAAYLYKFPSYVDWPAAAFPRPDMPFTIGVAGDDGIAAELRRIAGSHTIGGRPVIVRDVREPGQADSLQLLFVGHGDPGRTETAISWVRDRPCLVVTDGDRLPRGSMIHFVLDDGRIRFDISQAAAADRGLTLSSRLLAVAHQVYVRNP